MLLHHRCALRKFHETDGQNTLQVIEGPRSKIHDQGVFPAFHTLLAGLLIFRTVADPRNSGISAKSREIPQKTRNTAKSARNISKYMSAKHI